MAELDEVSKHGVALLAEGVDRNFRCPAVAPPRPRVALLAEGVDRNLKVSLNRAIISVALLAEGVDRNPLRA